MKNKWLAYIALFLLAIILPVCTVYLFRFLQRCWPVPQNCKKLIHTFDELNKKYHKWDLFGGLFMIPLGFIGGYASWELCRALCAWRATFFVGEYLLFPKHGICLFPVVPGAIIFGGVGVLISYKILLKSQFSEFACYGNLKLGINVIRLLKFMLVISSIFWFAGIALPFDTYMILSHKNIKYNCLMGFNERTYQYSDVKSVEHIIKIKNQFKKDNFINIFFKDGNIWSNANTEEISNERAKNIVNYLAQNTNLKIIKRSERLR